MGAGAECCVGRIEQRGVGMQVRHTSTVFDLIQSNNNLSMWALPGTGNRAAGPGCRSRCHGAC